MNQIGAMTTAELVEQFTAIALKQDEAIRNFNSRTFNRIYIQMETIKAELKSRKGDQRTALLPLYKHRNGQVRLKAAIATSALEPKAARRVLRGIADAEYSPQTADARDILEGLDSGEYK